VVARGEGAGKTALVTGASAGIGRELALEFAAHGFDLVLVARSADKLEEVAEEARRHHGVEARVDPRDLLDPDTPKRLFDDLAAQRVPIEVLVNDAGLLEHGWFQEMAVDRIVAMLELNVRALTVMTRLFLTPMVAGGGGQMLGSTRGRGVYAGRPVVDNGRRRRARGTLVIGGRGRTGADPCTPSLLLPCSWPSPPPPSPPTASWKSTRRAHRTLAVSREMWRASL
jgi:NAD(P)-dependent dehydrogenase (short-subunit alcohol dehydrogenase family)